MKEKSFHPNTNRLIHETSPYLLQHAHNPVDWHAWNEETLEKARQENKMLIVSIGYSACHWCHVMERESFEDGMVADLMNRHFLPVKVDREERPDIDDVYMSACHITNNGGCGWPLNAFALPDGSPVWAGTYFPREKWMQVLRQFIHYQEKEPEKLREAAANLVKGIQQIDRITASNNDSLLSDEAIQAQSGLLLNRMDPHKGGRKGHPKFPMPTIHEFLLRHHFQTKSPSSLRLLEISLQQMAMGGIYDQLGGGFARYSTDADWFVPHFEKMLYDNAQLISLYAKAYRLTKNPLYLETVGQSVEFVLRELSTPESGFYSALDADSEGEEGKYYVWTHSEMEECLTDPDEFHLVTDFYSVTKEGNWEKGQNILYRNLTVEEYARLRNYDPVWTASKLASAKTRLLDKRAGRKAPGLDDKVLASWNGLMIRALAEAYKAAGKEEWRQMALRSGHFALEKFIEKDFRVNRSYKEGQSRINGFLDDYAHLTDAFLALYEISFDEEWLHRARSLTEYCLIHFYNSDDNTIYYTSDLDREIVTRKTEWTDNVIPGSVSSMAHNLFRLGHLFEEESFLNIASKLLLKISPSLEKTGDPSFYTHWFSLAVLHNHPPYEIVITGPDAHALRDELLHHPLGDAWVLGTDDISRLPLVQDKSPADENKIFVCRNKVCDRPVKTVTEAIALLK